MGVALSRSAVTGVLLAGGRSRRMFEGTQGGDKGLLALGQKPMLAHVIARLEPQTGRLVINANGDPARFAHFRLPVAPDRIAEFAGPLAGVLAGMQWSRAHAPAASHVVTVSTDAPFLPGDLVRRLAGELPEGKPGGIALAASGGQLHPVIGLWPVGLADDLEAALDDGVRKVLAWTDRHPCATVDFPFHSIGSARVDPFFNANTPQEFEQAQALLASRT